MTGEILLILIILVVAIVLFSMEWFAADVVALGVLLTLIVTGLLPPDRAFEGFGSDAVIMILGLLILTSALLRTGVVDLSGRAILRTVGTNPDRILLLVMVAAALLSAFISNTAATAFFLPITVGMAARSGISPSKLLMPLAYSSILTSSVTLVSTSTNIVISNIMTRHQMAPMGMFELAPVGIPIAVLGLVYMYLFGRRLIPERSHPSDLIDDFGLRPYLSEIIILPDSHLVGKSLAETGLGRELDLTVLEVIRGKEKYLVHQSDTVLQANDVLLVEGKREEILKIKDTAGIEIKPDVKLSDPLVQSSDLRLAEVILLPGSDLIGGTLKSYRFRQRYELQVLAINRHRGVIHDKLSVVRLRLGDVLLVEGHRDKLAALSEDRSFRILGAIEEKRPNLSRAPIAIGIFVAALGAATFGLVSLPVATLAGALLAFATGCITPEEAYRELEWRALILIACMMGLGAAMESTGTARYLAAQIVTYFSNAGSFGLLTGFFAFTVLLTQPMSNQAAAIVVLPVAIQTANQLGLNPRSFAMMIAVAASCSYLTPLEPSCLMVYGPGRYRFIDFLKVGALLTLLIYAAAIVLVPHIWPLK